jgi:L,D-peptidoglycan transpeptidase YkuD (ErfK/YbiS/YcfS/YnhG family)
MAKRAGGNALLIAFTLVWLAAPLAPSRAADGPCPKMLWTATRLLLVISPDMSVDQASARRFERASRGSTWREVRSAMPVALGGHGLGWAWNQTDLAESGEPTKTEGDKRTPAGVFAIGPAFGFAAEGPGGGYLPLKRSQSICVNDPRSDRYNEIVSKGAVDAGISRETMSEISLYRRGLRIEFPTSREERGGSCIFIHVWRRRDAPTLGCLAVAEDDVVELQRWAAAAPAVVAVLPRQALERLKSCLPPQ